MLPSTQVVADEGARVEGKGAEDLAEGKAVHELFQADPPLLVDAVALDQRDDRHAAAEAGGADDEEHLEYLPQGDSSRRFHDPFIAGSARPGKGKGRRLLPMPGALSTLLHGIGNESIALRGRK